MAEEVEMTPVTGAELPKTKPTLKLSPALKPGLKLPPKPGLPSGLKLPPKPGATQTALKPGLKLPTQNALKPGLKLPTQNALKPGIKLPAKPVIRKPGATVAGAPLPKPITGAPLPKPVAPAASAPAAKPIAVDAQGVGKLPTVSAAAVSHDTAAAEVVLPKPMEALKSVTQKLKGITQEIPQQAILHKTGIIAEGGSMSDAQKEAVKHKTARISLSDAMGVAPVKNEAAPMKTIRIKRPINIPSPTSTLTPQPATPAAPAGPAAPVAPAVPAAPAAEKPAEPAPTLTQRKTLKISRPGAARPGAKFGVKRPAAAPAAAKPAPEETAAADGAVADIPDIPSLPSAPVPSVAPAAENGLAWTLSALVQLAACAVIGALAWFLYENSQLPTFCGGLGWGS